MRWDNGANDAQRKPGIGLYHFINTWESKFMYLMIHFYFCEGELKNKLKLYCFFNEMPLMLEKDGCTVIRCNINVFWQ